jgi:hypothetical protein
MLNESLSARGKAAASAENARRCLEAADAKAAEKRAQRRAAVEMVDHRDRAGGAQRDERTRRAFRDRFGGKRMT